jgi:dTDP-4-amino-4,6-dideoxygalactose transaminase
VGGACANSGTSALNDTVLATTGRATAARPFALIPAFTFVATAIAAERRGYRPYLADVDANTWLLDPERLIGEPDPRPGQLGHASRAVRPPRSAPSLASIREKTGVPVIVDAAASCDRIVEAPQRYLGAIPVAISFHATKGFGTGEGGGVASTDTALMPRVVQALNSGFHRTRDSETPGINDKMSEYHAAVGLAELDGWPEKRRALQTAIQSYRRTMTEAGLESRFVSAGPISGRATPCSDGVARPKPIVYSKG